MKTVFENSSILHESKVPSPMPTLSDTAICSVLSDKWKDTTTVSFRDYESDTKEISERSARITRSLRAEIRKRDELIAILIKAAGGEIRVGLEVVANPPTGYTEWEDVANNCRIFKVRT